MLLLLKLHALEKSAEALREVVREVSAEALLSRLVLSVGDDAL